MPYSYAPQFRAMVVEQVRSGRRVAEVAATLELAEGTVYRWVRQDRIDRGELAGTSTPETAELRAARRRIAELESELATVRRASDLLPRGGWCAQKTCSGSWRRWLRRAMAPRGFVASWLSLRRVSSRGVPTPRVTAPSVEPGSPI